MKTGAKIAGKKAKKKPKRNNKGKPQGDVSHHGPKPNESIVPGGAAALVDDFRQCGKRRCRHGYR